MSVDGRVCAVGSANLDVTAGYWESELLLGVEDESIATGVEARFSELIATSGVAGVAFRFGPRNPASHDLPVPGTFGPRPSIGSTSRARNVDRRRARFGYAARRTPGPGLRPS
jgi:hypothetical protein